MSRTIFQNRRPNTDKLLRFGFEKAGNGYVYRTDLLEGQMRLTVRVEETGEIDTRVVDIAAGEDYVLHRVAGAAGPFVGRVRSEYEAALEEIAASCFDRDVFQSEQAKAVIAYVGERYADEPEYLWEKFPDNAVVRRRDNRKWYVALLTVSRRKLGFDRDEPVEILDLKMAPDDIRRMVDGQTYLPGYHMNKKHWYTICLDGSVPLEEIYRRIDESYALSGK